ncbi:DedA family protein/thiosulfate sulfurtransferase GlpE [Comamonas sp. JUb58]|uniref:DedA family protein/thiosulfate sulfurtransferase GlpE n=1 Tax=Comamonas sp. JUb58 TaxID=2485114 RepID=UPI001061C26A|nr:DedA family protein/thiosulfate sulfurtransferase GlpE [Comamonas sp. JUb58]TDS84108.1 membrane protein DedA with SNARE-associated domain [Comamonas sp. JUb58]
MDLIVALVREYGVGIVFLNVLIEQLGAPIPAYPVLMVTGAIHGHSLAQQLLLVVVAVVAALLADGVWYVMGRRYGRRVLSRICKISLSPDSCVQNTESLYGRWGAKSLLIAKFVPGFASIASALAGAVGTTPTRFVLFDGLGALLWVGSAVLLGGLFSSTVEDLLAVLAQLGQWGLLLLGIVFAVFIARRWWSRRQVIRSLRMERLTVDELNDMLGGDELPVILDVRAGTAFEASHIPGAHSYDPHANGARLPAIDPEASVIIYCACPNEVSAARIAQLLRRAGIRRVRPLLGGIDAWVDAGYQVHGSSAAPA